MDPVQQVIQLEKQVKRLQLAINERDAEIGELKEQLIPVIRVKEREERVKILEDQFDQRKAIQSVENKYIAREALMCRTILSSILTKKEVIERVWTETNSVPMYNENGAYQGSYNKPTVCQSKDTYTDTPNLNPSDLDIENFVNVRSVG